MQNGTGFHKVLVQNSREGESGRIVALSDNTNSLPVEIRAKMAQTIVGSDFRQGVGLISVGSGGAEPGIPIGIPGSAPGCDLRCGLDIGPGHVVRERLRRDPARG